MKKILTFFFLWNCPLKGAQGDAVYILSALKVFWRGWSRRGRWKCILQMLFLFNSIDCGRLSFQVSQFLNTGIEQQHYKLLNTSVTLFLHILWRDSHSWSTTPRSTEDFYFIIYVGDLILPILSWSYLGFF